MTLPPEIKKFVDAFSELPGIGPRQATRLAFRLAHDRTQRIEQLAAAVHGLENVSLCETCFFPYSSSTGHCHFCTDPSRDQSLFMLVEKETDLVAIERAGAFRGRYCVIGPLEKSGALDSEHERRLALFQKTIATTAPGGIAQEIIIAFSPTTAGDINADRIAQPLRSYARAISRIGRGIPTGGEIEFADDETLAEALGRRSSS
ncbi:MAG: toprim domain-containing protein [Candidatus Paceibacterota bacterium]|jgi:recombination protein RecR